MTPNTETFLRVKWNFDWLAIAGPAARETPRPLPVRDLAAPALRAELAQVRRDGYCGGAAGLIPGMAGLGATRQAPPPPLNKEAVAEPWHSQV